MNLTEKPTLIGNSVTVHVHHGAHGTEEVPAHSHHRGEQVLEAVERIVEQRADASAVASVRRQEVRQIDHRRAVVHIIGHLKTTNTETELMLVLM